MNGGSLRSDDLPKGPVTRAELVSLLPFLSEVIVVDMPGSLLRSALQHGISGLSNWRADSTDAPHGKFLQVSSTLRFEWYFDYGVPTLGSVTVDGSALDDEASYKVAVSEFIANGGDGFDQFAGLDRMSRGLTQADTVALYLAQFTAGSPLPAPSDGRIMQTPDVVHPSSPLPSPLLSPPPPPPSPPPSPPLSPPPPPPPPSPPPPPPPSEGCRSGRAVFSRAGRVAAISRWRACARHSACGSRSCSCMLRMLDVTMCMLDATTSM